MRLSHILGANEVDVSEMARLRRIIEAHVSLGLSLTIVLDKYGYVRFMTAANEIAKQQTVVDAARVEACNHQHGIGYPCSLCDSLRALDGEP
jgi:hypothetical protein